MDLRARSLSAIDGGAEPPRRCATLWRFDLVGHPDAQRRTTGSFAPKAQGGDTRSQHIEARHAEVIGTFEVERDQSLDELRARLAERGLAISTSTLSRVFQRHAMTREKRPPTRPGRIDPSS